VIRRPPGSAIARGISEFGELLAELTEATPGARGAVLSDGRGDAIDFAHRPERIGELDLQIAGAQVGQAMARLQHDAVRFRLGAVDLVLQGSRGTLLTSQVGREYLLTLMLEQDANIGVAARRFARTRGELLRLLA
jgi:predicted regulator of Ras-like GTPase activity (Roadblock/LC7/MglB family)